MEDSDTRSAMACWWSLQVQVRPSDSEVKLCVSDLFYRQYLQLVDAPTISLSLFRTEEQKGNNQLLCFINLVSAGSQLEFRETLKRLLPPSHLSLAVTLNVQQLNCE